MNYYCLDKSVLVLICLLMAQQPVLAYKVSTHTKFSQYAADNSVLGTAPTLLSDFGLGSYGTEQFINSNGDDPMNLRDIIAFGSTFEDDGPTLSNPSVTWRFLRHFFDPQNNKGLEILFTEYPKSPDWALEMNQAQSSVNDPLQAYSYKDARDFFHAAFACQTSACRLDNFSNTFQTIGHVIHHLQDMGQPQHSRLDIHFTDPTGTFENPDAFYELYTASIIDNNLASFVSSPPYSQPPAGQHYFSLPRSYWQTDDPNDNSGMAEFSGTQFVTIGTLFEEDGSSASGFTNHSGLPLPDGSGLVKVPSSVTLTDIGGETLPTAVMDFLVGTVNDPLKSAPVPNVKLASYSILDGHIGSLKVVGVNSAVFDDRFPLLIPRIAAFSTDFINYFFRGRVDMVEEAGSGNNWRIQNKSTETMSGTFRLYSEAGGTRSLVTSWNLTIPAGGSSTPQTFQVPGGSVSKYALVFRGQLGAETDAVAGKVLNLNTCTENCADCGVPITPQGGQSSQVQTYTYPVGSQFPQDLSLFFEAYSIPDQLQVKSGNNVLYTTPGGLVSGLHTKTINYDPNVHGSSLDVLINAPTNGTAWNFCLDCNSSSEICGQHNEAYTDPVVVQGAISGSGTNCSASAIFSGRTNVSHGISAPQNGNTINISLLPDTYSMQLNYSSGCGLGTSNDSVALSISLEGQVLTSRGFPNTAPVTFTVPGRLSTTNDGS